MSFEHVAFALPAKVLAKIEFTQGCWLWRGIIDAKGYGRAGAGSRGKTVLAHRLVYELLVGPIPLGLELDHLCRVTRCVNPAHLEPVTHAENMARSWPAVATHCKRGHEFTPDNTFSPSPRQKRRCRVCHRVAQAEGARRRRAQRKAAA